MRALTTTVANNRLSTSGGVLSDAAPDEWMELIRVFASLNPHMMVPTTSRNIAATIDRARMPGERNFLRQCDRKIGTSGRLSILLVAPPRINSRIRECPYAPITKRLPFRYVK